MGLPSKVCRNRLCVYFLLIIIAKICWNLLTPAVLKPGRTDLHLLQANIGSNSNVTEQQSSHLKQQSSYKAAKETCKYCLPHHSHGITFPNVSDDKCGTLNRRAFQTELFCLEGGDDLIHKLFKQANTSLCHIYGAVNTSEKLACKCREGWYGTACSVPEYLYKSNYPRAYRTKLREIPARIIYGFPFNHEFEMLEAKLDELGDLVDVFIITESNFTAHGDAKPRLLLERLSEGYLQKYHSKIFHVSIDYFPEEAHSNGWVVEELSRHMISLKGVSRIKHLRMDDIFIVTDADELPAWETLFFLKFHTGYPGPIGFNLKLNVFGFFWQARPKVSNIFGACSISMLKLYFDNNAYKLRGARSFIKQNALKTASYKSRFGDRLWAWSFGQIERPAGWHCSWCFNASAIRTKLLSAQVDDKPRWGDYPEKTNITYIESLIQNGGWFDDKDKHTAVKDSTSKMYAPSFFKRHPERAPHLLTNFNQSHF